MFSAALKSGAAAAPKDAQFNYVTMLLHGDGTNGGQNNTFLDSSSNNFTITRNGNTTQGSFSPYGSNWSNYFDGSSGIQAADNTALQMGSSSFTLECWVNFSAVPAGATGSVLISKFLTNNNGYEIVYYNGLIYFQAPTAGFTVTYSWAPSAGTWYHIAGVRNGSSVVLYINGTQVATGTASGAITDTATSVWLGKRNDNTLYLNGYLSNVRIVKGTALYTSNFTPSTTPLTAVSGTSLLTCQSNRFIDNSSNNFALTVNGTPSVQRFSPFAPSAAYSTATIGGSGYFDGSGDYLNTGSNSAFAFGLGDFTLECWVYATSTPSDMGIYEGRSTGASVDGLTLTAFSSSVIRIYAGGIVVASSGTNYIGAWTHVAVTRASGTTTLWINGVSQGTSLAVYNCTNTDAVVGGGRYSIGTNVNTYFPGYIANFRMVKGTAVYTSTFTPPSAPLTAITNTSLLCNFTNGAIYDNAMMNDLETVGNAQISTSVKKYGTGSMAFDGTGDWLVTPTTANLQMGSGSFTWECWFYPTALPSSGNFKTLWAQRATGAGYGGPCIVIDSAGNYLLYISNAAGSNWAISGHNPGFSVSLNTWQHLALVKNGTTLTLYKDGTGGTSTTSSDSIGTSGSTSIGAGAADGASQEVTGYIDDLRITKGYARYTANFTPPTAAFPNQ